MMKQQHSQNYSQWLFFQRVSFFWFSLWMMSVFAERNSSRAVKSQSLELTSVSNKYLRTQDNSPYRQLSSVPLCGENGVFKLSDLDGINGFRVDGIDSEDRSGFSVSTAGDVNGDGFADVIIGAYQADPNGLSDAGESCVVYGGLSVNHPFNLSSLNGINGFCIEGIDSDDFSGFSVSTAGDVNGDGYADVIIGAYQVDLNGIYNAGESYVLYGGANISHPFDLSGLNGVNGFRIEGIDSDDFSGFSVSTAGDVNGDGYADVIIGAYQADPNGITNAGESYVVYGGVNTSHPFSLSNLNGVNGFRIDGYSHDGSSGTLVATAGDVNGDGYADVIIGSNRRELILNVGLDTRTHYFADKSYVLYGGVNISHPFSLDSLNGTNGFRIDGSGDQWIALSEATAGDVNGDGCADVIIIGVYQQEPNGGYYNAGEIYVVYGGVNISHPFLLSSLNGVNGFRIEAIYFLDSGGQSVSSAGDVNGDGYADVIIGAYQADLNGIYNAGESYVLYGGANISHPFDLSGLNGVNGFRIEGIDSYDLSGFSVSTAGDVNGDGYADVIIGAYQADPNGISNAGESYVVLCASQLSTRAPTSRPSSSPSSQPSNSPTVQPSSSPTLPTSQPSSLPSSQPSDLPTSQPSSLPSSRPSDLPTSQPSNLPSSQPSNSPTAKPSSIPTQPTSQPSNSPTSQPSNLPTSQPSSSPTLPTSQPSSSPTSPTPIPVAAGSGTDQTQPPSDLTPIIISSVVGVFVMIFGVGVCCYVRQRKCIHLCFFKKGGDVVVWPLPDIDDDPPIDLPTPEYPEPSIAVSVSEESPEHLDSKVSIPTSENTDRVFDSRYSMTPGEKTVIAAEAPKSSSINSSRTQSTFIQSQQSHTTMSSVASSRHTDPQFANSQQGRQSSERHQPTELVSVEIAKEKIELKELLGKGAYGEVYRAIYARTPVAVKRYLGVQLSAKQKQRIYNEIRLMRDLRHDHLVMFRGVVDDTIPWLVMEFCAGGDLYHYLYAGVTLDWGIRLRIACDVINGLEFLHDNKIIHCDLKSPNILLDGNKRAKLSDFGFSEVKQHSQSSVRRHEQSESTGDLVGTYRWMAPELFKNATADATYQSDIWALGMVLYEIGQQKIPFAKARTDQQVIKWIESLDLDPISPEVSVAQPDYCELMQDCYKAMGERPKIKIIADRMNTIYSLFAATKEVEIPVKLADGVELSTSIPGLDTRQHNPFSV